MLHDLKNASVVDFGVPVNEETPELGHLPEPVRQAFLQDSLLAQDLKHLAVGFGSAEALDRDDVIRDVDAGLDDLEDGVLRGLYIPVAF